MFFSTLDGHSLGECCSKNDLGYPGHSLRDASQVHHGSSGGEGDGRFQRSLTHTASLFGGALRCVGWPYVLEKAPGKLLSSVGLTSWGHLAFPFLFPLRFLALVTLLKQRIFSAQVILF